MFIGFHFIQTYVHKNSDFSFSGKLHLKSNKTSMCVKLQQNSPSKYEVSSLAVFIPSSLILFAFKSFLYFLYVAVDRSFFKWSPFVSFSQHAGQCYFPERFQLMYKPMLLLSSTQHSSIVQANTADWTLVFEVNIFLGHSLPITPFA